METCATWERLPEELVAAVRGRLIVPAERCVGRSGVSFRDLLTYAVALDDLFYRPWRQFLDAGTKRKRGTESGWTAAQRVLSVQREVRLLLRGLPGATAFVGVVCLPAPPHYQPGYAMQMDPRLRFYTDTIRTLSADDRVPRCVLVMQPVDPGSRPGCRVCVEQARDTVWTLCPDVWTLCPEPGLDGRPGDIYTITTRLHYRWVGVNIPGAGFQRVALKVYEPPSPGDDPWAGDPRCLEEYLVVLRCRPGKYFRCRPGKYFATG